MKNLFSSRFFFALIGIIGVVVGLNISKVTFAQAIDGSNLEAQISRLVEAIDRAFVSKNGTSTTALPRHQTNSKFILGCTDNYTSWPHSNTFTNEGDWNLNFRQKYYGSSGNQDWNRTERFIDLNGDGLIDYFYYDGYTSQYEENYLYTCVYLNNGHGFDEAYKCVGIKRVNGGGGSTGLPITYAEDYYGDCADTSG